MGQFCRFCAAPLDAQSRFCSSCGRPVTVGGNRRLAPLLLVWAGLLVGGGLMAAAAVFYLGADSEPPEAVPTTAPPTTIVATTIANEPLSVTTSGQEAAPPTTDQVEFDSAELARQFGDAVWKVEVSGCGVTASGSSFAIPPHHLEIGRASCRERGDV